MIIYRLENNVFTTLLNTISDIQTDNIIIRKATSPFNDPLQPANGEISTLTIADNQYTPSKIEIIGYTGLTDNGDDTYTLTGVTRGLENTTSTLHFGASIVTQSWTRESINSIITNINGLSDDLSDELNQTITNNYQELISITDELSSAIDNNTLSITNNYNELISITDGLSSVVPIYLSELLDDINHRTVTDTEKSTWNGKQDALGFTPENISNKVVNWQLIPDNTHYPSELLVKNELNSISSITDELSSAIDNILIESTNWNIAYGWGNHADVGYVTGTPWTELGYLNETSHDLLDHTGLQGILSITDVTNITDELSSAIDNAIIDATNTFIQTNQTILNNYNELINITDELSSAIDEIIPTHNQLDHTGLPGIIAIGTGSNDAMAGNTFIPSISGLIDENEHDLLDHTGLTGIPSIDGLLNETSHDLLDHTGLTGIHASGSDAETATSIAVINHGTAEKTTLVDADEITGQNSENNFSLIRTTWTNVKSFLKTYFDGIYATITTVLGKKNYHGIESHGVLSFDNSTHILTIGSATNTYWYKGTKYTTELSITCDLDSFETLTDNTLYFFWFDDATGILKANTDPWNLKEKVSVAIVFWNGSIGAVLDETHSHTRDIDWHINAHNTIGTRYGAGLDKTNPTTTNDSLLEISTGTIHDEDNIHTISSPQTNCRIYYQVSNGVYTFVNSSLPYAGTSGQPQWLDIDDYTLKDVGATEFVCMWVYASPDISTPIYIIPSQISDIYTTLSLARDETPPNLFGLNLSPEMKLLYKFIYKGDGEFQESIDYRTSSSLPAGGTSSSTAGSISFIPTGNISSVTVQTALEELDTEKQVVMGLDDNYVTDVEKSNLHAPGSDNQDLSGLVTTSQSTPQSIGDIDNKLLELWVDDIHVTNTISGSITGTSSGLSETLEISSGGTGNITAQDAINELTNVSSATNEYVLTKDTATGNAIFKSGYTDELAQDAVGSMIDTDASTGHIIFTYADATPKLSAKVLKPVEAKGSVSGAQTFDLTSYGCITITSGGNITVDLTGTYTSGKLYVSELVITNGGANTWGWASKFHFVASTVPTLTASGVDSFTLLTRNGGTTCMVFTNGKDVKAD